VSKTQDNGSDLLNIPLEEFDAPLFQALLGYVRQRALRFHMPGHKGGLGFPPEVAEAFRRNVLAIDVTETRGMDNLHLPSGCIKQAQDLAAHTFGADRTFFLTNGTTAGVHADNDYVQRGSEDRHTPRRAPVGDRRSDPIRP